MKRSKDTYWMQIVVSRAAGYWGKQWYKWRLMRGRRSVLSFSETEYRTLNGVREAAGRVAEALFLCVEPGLGVKW